MPGIVGLVTKMPRERAERELGRMLASTQHEPFYQTGTWCDESLGVYVGWAARKGSFADGMPLHNETGDVVLIFSGEDFPEPGTHADLKARGHQITGCGASYLVHAYEDAPSAFPAALNGRFHGVVIDRRDGRATLFNDRYGMHRVYIHESTDAFYFAAEAKAILAVRPELRKVDARGFGELVSMGCVLENRALFEGIGLLPGAAAWTFSSGRLERRHAYFQPKDWES